MFPPSPTPLADRPRSRGVTRSSIVMSLSIAVLLHAPVALRSAAEPPTTRPGGSQLESLLAEFARMPGLAARFREEKHMELLHEPLVSRGMIYFARPGRLARYTEEPARSTLLVEGRKLSYAASGVQRTLDIDAHPMLAAFVRGLRLILEGDLRGLRDVFVMRLDDVGHDGAWELVLEPRHDALKRSVKMLRVSGRGRSISELRILERAGDATHIVFSAVDSNRRFTTREITEFFGLPAP